MFYVILKGRNAFLDYINKKLKNSKNWIFPKGLVHGFGQKLVIFAHFYFRENRPEEFVLNQKSVFYDNVEGRNAFLDYRNKKLKNPKNWIFPKGLLHGFGQKLVIFPDFYFRENKAEKCVLRYSRRKK